MAELITIKVDLDTTEALDKVSILNMQVDRLLSKLEKCSGLCDACKITTEVKISPVDLVAVGRLASTPRDLQALALPPICQAELDELRAKKAAGEPLTDIESRQLYKALRAE